jgi:hypothetical protein
MHLTSEEDLYAAARAMREGMRPKSKGKGKAGGALTTPPTSLPPSASDSSIALPSSASSASSTTTTTTDNSPPHTPTGPETQTETGGPQTPLTFDPDMARYPPSMTSSVRDHVYEGGLRYHAYRAGKYAFPNDEIEQNRDDMKHTMTLMLCRGAYFYAPVEEALEAGGEVLDLGEFFFLYIYFWCFCFLAVLLLVVIGLVRDGVGLMVERGEGVKGGSRGMRRKKGP